MKRLLGLVAMTAIVAMITGFAPAQQSGTPGVEELVNFQHVYNYKPTVAGIDPTGRGTDIEFYTADVPKRDYVTGQLLDEAGLPLQPGLPPVMVTRDFAVMGSYGGGAFVFDITNPEAPQFVKNITCNQTQNDVQIKKFGDRWVLALARDGGSNPCVNPQKGTSGAAGIAVFDITDPYAFLRMYSFRTTGGAHNFTFHPTKPFGVVSTGDLPGAVSVASPGQNHIPIIDFTDVNNPVLAADIKVPAGGPHDISFSPDGNRMFVANENNGIIFDTTDPKAPVQVGITPNAGTYFHGFDPTPDGKIAIATNESLALGGFFASGTTVCPGEGITFYNVDGAQAQAPLPVGHFDASVRGSVPPTINTATSPPSVSLDGRACTAHVGEIAQNSKIYVTGWYVGGVRLVDFTTPATPREIGIAQMADAEVWAAKFHKGPYVFAADMRRGFDVFKWNGGDTAPWLTA